jgi:hypothetical protein
MNDVEKMQAAAARVAELGGQLIMHAEDGSYGIVADNAALAMRQGTLSAVASYIGRMERHLQAR